MSPEQFFARITFDLKIDCSC